MRNDPGRGVGKAAVRRISVVDELSAMCCTEDYDLALEEYRRVLKDRLVVRVLVWKPVLQCSERVWEVLW